MDGRVGGKMIEGTMYMSLVREGFSTVVRGGSTLTYECRLQ